MKTEDYLKIRDIHNITIIGTGGGCDVLEKELPGKWLAWCSDGDGNAPVNTQETDCVVYLYPDEEDCSDFVLAFTGRAFECIDFMATLENRPSQKQFVVVWDSVYTDGDAPSKQEIVRLDHFDTDKGYSQDDIRRVNTLHVAESVNICDGWMMGRVCAVRIA